LSATEPGRREEVSNPWLSPHLLSRQRRHRAGSLSTEPTAPVPCSSRRSRGRRTAKPLGLPSSRRW